MLGLHEYHVHHVYNLLQTTDGLGDFPLYSHTELCVNILSSHIGKGNQSRGASPSLLKDIVKGAWISGLISVATDWPECTTDSTIIDVLLNSIGASDGDTAMKHENEEGIVDEKMDVEEPSDFEEDDDDGPQTPNPQGEAENNLHHPDHYVPSFQY